MVRVEAVFIHFELYCLLFTEPCGQVLVQPCLLHQPVRQVGSEIVLHPCFGDIISCYFRFKSQVPIDIRHQLLSTHDITIDRLPLNRVTYTGGDAKDLPVVAEKGVELVAPVRTGVVEGIAVKIQIEE